MAQLPLERLLIYTDKKHIEDFELSTMEFNELYELYVTTKDEILDQRISSVDFFNELFYYITFIYENKDSAERLDDFYSAHTALYPPVAKYKNPKNQVDKIQGAEYAALANKAKRYIMAFVWLILNKQQQLPQHVAFFRAALNKRFDKDGTAMAKEFRTFLQNHPEKYNISFDPHPEFGINLLLRGSAEWQEATLDFDRIEILNIVRHFSREEQQQIIAEIKEAYMIRKGDGIEKQISSVTHQKRANENFLDNLVLDENLKLLNSIAESNEPLTQDPTMHSGFEAYIIKDQQKVLDILMLIANMGNSQLAILIKFIKAFQQLKYIQADCFINLDLFIKNAADQFPGVSFDKANVKKYIQTGNKPGETAYVESVQKIATYLQPLL